MNLFYSKNTTVNRHEIVIIDQENRHLTKVLRKKIGDSIHVTNGEGILFKCTIDSLHIINCKILFIFRL